MSLFVWFFLQLEGIFFLLEVKQGNIPEGINVHGSIYLQSEGRRQRHRTCTIGKICSSVFGKEEYLFCKEWRILDKRKAHIAGTEALI